MREANLKQTIKKTDLEINRLTGKGINNCSKGGAMTLRFKSVVFNFFPYCGIFELLMDIWRNLNVQNIVIS